MRILPYTDALAPAFRAINEAWIEDMFVLEDHDRHVLAHPRECIVDPGGTILFAATDEGQVIGTGALMPTGPGAVELTKMGVLAAEIMARWGHGYARCDVAMRLPLAP